MPTCTTMKLHTTAATMKRLKICPWKRTMKAAMRCMGSLQGSRRAGSGRAAAAERKGGAGSAQHKL